MKHSLFFVIFVLFSFYTNAQTEWFVEGSKWNYMVDPGFTPDYGRGDAQIILEGDTLINSQNYKVLSHIQITPNYILNKIDTTLFPNIYVRQDGNDIYHLEANGDEFLLFEFDAEVGDTLASNAVVMSIDSIEHNGEFLKLQIVKFLCWQSGTNGQILSSFSVAFIEKYGVDNFPFLYFNLYAWGCTSPPSDFGHHNLKCFADSEIGEKLFFGDDCSIEEELSSSKQNPKQKALEIIKSPGFISLKEDFNIEQTQIIDLNGQVVLTPKDNSGKIPVSHLTSGIYLLRVQTVENEIYSAKFFHTY